MPRLPDNWGEIVDIFSDSSKYSYGEYIEKRFEYMKELQEKIIRKEHELKSKAFREVVQDVPVIESFLSFEDFFGSSEYYTKTDLETYTHVYDNRVTIRQESSTRWRAFINEEPLKASMWMPITSKQWLDSLVSSLKDEMRAGKFKYVQNQTPCDKCNNTKVIIEDTVEHSVYNGFKVNIHQKQEIPCTCNS